MVLIRNPNFFSNTKAFTAPPSVDDLRDKSHFKLPIVLWVVDVYLDDIGVAT
jgi:hypothetical protein